MWRRRRGDVGKPRAVCWFKRQNKPGFIEGWSDSDWAGCLETRKSTSGGLLKWGSHILKCWSVTQNVIATSSGEAEFYAMVKTASQSLGMKVMMEDLGMRSQIKIITDVFQSLQRTLLSFIGLPWSF